MTAKQYADYEKAVADFLKRNDVKGNGPEHTEPDPGFEGFFSWRPCGCCGSGLGGTREDYIFANGHNETFTEAICVDCVYYLAYGQLDDSTMLEIEESERAS